MEPRGRTAFREMVDARIAEWEKNITLLGHRMAKGKDDPELKERVEQMKSKLPQLAERSKVANEIPDAGWPDFKSEVDLILESLIGMQRWILRKLGGA